MKITRLAAIFAATIFATAAMAQTTQSPIPRTITVSGNAEVKVAPDHASISLGVISDGKTADEAQTKANAVIDRLLKAIDALKISKSDVQTSNLSLYPVYANPRPGQEQETPAIVGYRASNTVTITVTDFKLIGRVVDEGIKSGVNQVNSIQFGLRNDGDAKDQALKKAVEEAKRKASVMAMALGVTLGAVLDANDNGAQIMPPMPMYGKMAMDMGRAGGESTSVEPGQITVTATVSVRYQIGS